MFFSDEASSLLNCSGRADQLLGGILNRLEDRSELEGLRDAIPGAELSKRLSLRSSQAEQPDEKTCRQR